MPKKPPASEVDRHSGLRLRAVRDAIAPAGPINQEFFASKIGTGRTALANWEGGRLPDVRAMVRLNIWLGIPLEWIYLGHVNRLPFEVAERLIKRASELGASVSGVVSLPADLPRGRYGVEPAQRAISPRAVQRPAAGFAELQKPFDDT